MSLLRYRLMLIISALLVQCCFADELLSNVETSSGILEHLDAESQSIQISDMESSKSSFSKSEAKLSASETEMSAKSSNFESVGDNVSIQDSNYYSSNKNVSGSESNITVLDGGVSQTESNFSTSSSTTADTDSSFISTPNGAVSSTSKSFSESKKSSSSTSSRSINGQLLGSDEFGPGQGTSVEDLLQSPNTFSQTRSLDSLPSSSGRPRSNQFPNSKFSNGSSRFPNSLKKNSLGKPGNPKSNYLPVGSFNSIQSRSKDTTLGPNSIRHEDFMKSIDILGSDESTFNKPLLPDSVLNSPSNNSPNFPSPLLDDSLDNSGSKGNYLPNGSSNSIPSPTEDKSLGPNSITPEDFMKSIDISGSDDFTFEKPLSPDSVLSSPTNESPNFPGPLLDDSLDNNQLSLPSSDTLMDSPLNSSSDSTTTLENSFTNDSSLPPSSTLSNFPSSECSSPDASHPTPLDEVISEQHLNSIDSLDTSPINLDTYGVPNSSPNQLSSSLDSSTNSSPSFSNSPAESSPFEGLPVDSNVQLSDFSSPLSESTTPTSMYSPSLNDDSPFLPNYQESYDSEALPSHIEGLPIDLDVQLSDFSSPLSESTTPTSIDSPNDDFPFIPNYQESYNSEDLPLPVDSSFPLNPYESLSTPFDHQFSESSNLPIDFKPDDSPLNAYPSSDSSFNSLYEGDIPFAPPSPKDSYKPQRLSSNDIYDDSPFSSNQVQQPYDMLNSPSTIDDLNIPINDYDDQVPYPSSTNTPYDSIISQSSSNNLPNDFSILENGSSLPISSPINSLDTNQDGFISPEEILTSSDLSHGPMPQHSPPTQSEFLDHLHPSKPRYDAYKNIPRKNYLKPTTDSVKPFLPKPLPPYFNYPDNYFRKYSYPHFPLQSNPSFPPYSSFSFLHPNYMPHVPQQFPSPLTRYPPHHLKHNLPLSPLDLPHRPLSLKPSPFYSTDLVKPPLQQYEQSPFETKISSATFEPDQEQFQFENSPLVTKTPQFSNLPHSGPQIPLRQGSSMIPQLPSRPHYKMKNWSHLTPLNKHGSPLPPNIASFSPSPSPHLDLNIAYPNSPSPTSPPQLPSLLDSPSSLDSTTSNLSPNYIQPSLSDSPSDLFPNYIPSQNSNSTPNIASLDVQDDIFNDLLNGLKQEYKITDSEYMLSNSIYPKDISSALDIMTDEELTYGIVIIGSSPAVLTALKPLSDLGKKILIVERGGLPPHVSESLYYRPKMMQSNYVRKIKSSAPYCDVEKIIHAPNVLGEESTYDSNIWDYGVKSKYFKWGKLCKKWTWSKILSYFPDDSNRLTCAVPTSLSIEDTKAINVITQIFSDAGLSRAEYVKGTRPDGLTVLPSLQENGENIILARKIFENLQDRSNIQLALHTIVDNIVFDNTGKAISINVRTSVNTVKTISVLDELIIGSNPVDTVQLLYQSGIGDYEKLQQLNIPAQINLPYVGREFLVTPLYFGIFYQFPQGTLLNNWESDLAGMEYLFGNYRRSSPLASDYYKAFLNIYESREANVILNFRVFSKSMSERLSSYIERLKYMDEEIKDYLMDLSQNYDLLWVVPQLTNVLSRGEIFVNRSEYTFELEPVIDTGMYQSKRDITIMQKAIKVLKSIAETQTFQSLNGKVVQIPVKQCGKPDFSTEYNRCSIRYLSLPNLHYSGGTIMGVNPFTSVVNEDCVVHGTKNLRIFSSSVVPYGTSTDSSAVSGLVGTYAAKLLVAKYQP